MVDYTVKIRANDESYYICDAMQCYAILYHLHNLKNVKNTHRGTCNFTKSSTPPWMFFTFFKLYKWYKIAQCIPINTLAGGSKTNLPWHLTLIFLLVQNKIKTNNTKCLC